MCGRVVQAKGALQVAIQCGLEVPDTRFANVPPRYNAAPSQELWAIRQNNDTGQRSLDLLTWGLTPHWSKQKPVNSSGRRNTAYVSCSEELVQSLGRCS